MGRTWMSRWRDVLLHESRTEPRQCLESEGTVMIIRRRVARKKASLTPEGMRFYSDA